MSEKMNLYLGFIVFTLLNGQNVGIGTSLPTERLHIQGNLRLEGAFMLGNNPGTPGQILFSQGPGVPPAWQTPFTNWDLWAIDAWNPSSTTSLGWTCTGCNGFSPWLSNCGSNLRMLGGYNICGAGCYFEKTFTNLPPHSNVMVEVFYFSIDSWDQQATGGGIDYIQIQIDGNPQIRCYPPGIYGSGSNPGRNTDNSVCGVVGRLDFGPFRCTAYANHTSSSVTIRISSGLNQAASDESIGIMAVKLYIKP